MWPFGLGCRSLISSGVFQGMTDWHCHLLPGVDDGVRTMEETIALLQLYAELGIREVWFTPHVMEDMPNETAKLRERFAEVVDEVSKLSVEVPTIHLAAEYMMDNLFLERLQKGDVLPIGESQGHLLVETSYYNPPYDLYGTLNAIKSAGYYPILAHPERYRYMDKGDYERLREMGVRFQCNLPSFVGAYGDATKKKAERLFRLGYYDFMGTDIHSKKSFKCTISEKSLRIKFTKT